MSHVPCLGTPAHGTMPQRSERPALLHRQSCLGCRLLGMFRTITNIWGDCCAVTVVEAWAKRHDNKLARLAKEADAASGAQEPGTALKGLDMHAECIVTGKPPPAPCMQAK